MADLFPDIAVGEVLVEGLTLPFVAEAAITKGQVVKVGAIAGAIAVGSRVKTAAGGKITVAADTDIVGILGIALQTFAAATADDGLIYLCPI